MATPYPTEKHRDRGTMIHPYTIIMALVLIGVSALFLAFSAAFIYTRVQSEMPPVQLPWMFVGNSLLLLASSYTINLAKKAYNNDESEVYKRSLLLTLILSICFLILQYVAWTLLFEQNITPSTSTSAGYLYVLSSVHFLHIFAGLPFLISFYIQAYKRLKDPVKGLMYFTSPEKKNRLKVLALYWHFMDALWLYLLAFLIINQLMY